MGREHAACALGVGLVVAACGSTPRTDPFATGSGETGDGPQIGEASDETSNGNGDTDAEPADSDGDEGDDDDDDDANDDDGAKFDVPPDDDIPVGPGCTKVDFLFVIDNSSSMNDNQQNLIGSFPGFIDAIESTVQAQDYHVMIVDSDETNAVYQCNGSTCGAEFPAPACCPVPTECNNTIGSGRNVSGASGSSCGFDEQYITSDEGDLASAFECAANVGTTGSANELPMTAMMRALSGEMNVAGGCNAGFLRDDAILVVTVVSDASPATANIEHGSGTPQQWHDAVVAAKGGNDNAIVVLGLFESSPAYTEWAESFGVQGFSGSSALPDYSPLFLDAVSTIDITCDEFEPEG